MRAAQVWAPSSARATVLVSPERQVGGAPLKRQQMERRLRGRERWFSTTLRAIGDAVVAVDINGCVSFMNRAAEVMLDRTLDEALGKPLHSVFRLVNEKTREPVPDPARLAIERRGRSRGLRRGQRGAHRG
jgi:PAS domain-containing protein